MASAVYAQGIADAMASHWTTPTIKGMLAKTGYSVDKETHQHLDDVVASRYGGSTDQTLGSKTITVDTVNNRVELGSSGTLVWSALDVSGSDAGIAVILYVDTGDPATSVLMAMDDTNDVTPNSTDVTYTPNAEGIVQIDYGA